MAGISDEAMYTAITERETSLREEYFSDEMFYDGTMYSPFKRCENEEEAAQSSSADGGWPSRGIFFSPIACSTLAEIDNLIARSSADDLRSRGCDGGSSGG